MTLSNSARVFVTAFFLTVICVDLLISQTAHQKKIRGVVIDKETAVPVHMAHVYISQTTTGTTTKRDGTFEFSTDLSGIHALVFSYIGYKTETRELNFYNEKNPFFEVELTPEPFSLKPVEVTASNKEWQENFKTFRQHFLGTTSVARETEIKNSWVINFNEDDEKNMIASASQPLEMVNHALGYHMHVELVEYKWPKNGEAGYYLFYSSYRELETDNQGERRRWERNRKDNYQGSFEHFLKCLYEGNLKRNNFEVVLADSPNVTNIPELDSLRTGVLRFLTDIQGLNLNNVKAYQLRSPVNILYGKKWFNKKRAKSRIVPMDSRGIFLVTNEARLVNPVSLRLDGEWASHRVANLLPTDYRLEE